MKSHLLLFTAFLLLVACGTNPNPKQGKFETVKVDALKDQDLFSYVKVKSFMDQSLVSNQEQQTLFLKGLNSFKNDKNLDSAEIYLKQSILTLPSNMAYYELGNVWMDKKDYHKAIEAYEMAERLGYEPFSKVLYNISCANSLLNETELAGQYLEFAIQAGYSNIENIEKDADLKNLRADAYLYKNHLNRGLKGLSNGDNLFWLGFKRQFNKSPFPLKLDENLDVLLINDETHISYDYEKYIAEMRDEKFSREVSKGFYYLSQVAETKEYVALVYVMKEEFWGDDAPLTFRIVTFTNTGKLIDKKEIAGRSDFSKPLKTALIKNDLSILVTSYDTQFEKSTEEEGYYDNKIVKKTKIGEEVFTINSKGKIVKGSNLDVSSK